MTHRETVTRWLLVILILLVGSWLVARLPDPAGIRTAVVERNGKVGTPVTLRAGTVKLVEVEGSKQIFAPEFTDANGINVAKSGQGVFVVPTLEVTGGQESTTFGNITLESADGRIFGGSQAVGGNGCGAAPPGLPIRCQLVFEVDPAALSGATLLVASSGDGDDAARIDLGISKARAKAFADHNATVKLGPTKRGWMSR